MRTFTLTGARRELHVLDVENLLGGTYFDLDDVQRLRAAYAHATTMSATSQVVVAASADASAIASGLGWPGAGLRVRHGRDGADLALLDLLEHEDVPGRFGEVFIASGDGIFAPVAAALGSRGVHVTVVSRRQALSTALLLACARVIYLPGPMLPAANALRRVA